MRKQIAAANWKMNLTYQQAEKLLDEILDEKIMPAPHQEVIFAVPFPYLLLTRSEVEDVYHYSAAAQNCHHKKSGAYTGEISADMLRSVGINYCIVGHSERREYNHEDAATLTAKVDNCIANGIVPIFCCGEPLSVREAGNQNEHVAAQLRDSLFHLHAEALAGIIVAYEPVWAIGTGKTATTAQAQEMHAFLRSVLEKQFGSGAASQVSILYGGSVKASNAAEIFACPDVDGGLVGGASLVAEEFTQIIMALK
jgi:triosephosphate isomerase